MTLRDAAMLALFQEYGPMDYQKSPSVFNADYRDFGDHDYGVVAAAAGHAKDEAIIAAGIYNATSTNDKSGAFFNNPKNPSFVERGNDVYKAGKITGTAN